MKIASLVLSILGALASLALGATWLSDAAESRELLDAAAAMGADMSTLESLVRAAYMLLAGSAASIAAGVFVMKGRGKLAGILLVLAVVAPAVFSAKTLLATFFLAIAAVLAFLSAPKASRI